MVQSKSKVDAEAERVIADLRTCHDELKLKLENEAVEVEVSRGSMRCPESRLPFMAKTD